MPLEERCIDCGKTEALDYDPIEWQPDGDCDQCGGASKWELRAPDGSGDAGAAELAAALVKLKQSADATGLTGGDSTSAFATPLTPAVSETFATPQTPLGTAQGAQSDTGATTDAEMSGSEFSSAATPRELPDWLPRSDWSDVFHSPGALENEPTDYAAERAAVTVEELRKAYTSPEPPRELAVTFRYQMSHQDWEATDGEYRRWAKYIDNVDEARWRVDREAVVAALPVQVQQKCKPNDFAAIAEVRRVFIISESLRPLTEQELALIRSSYDAGCDIIPLAAQWRRPPMLLMKALLRVKGSVPDDALKFKVWRMPARFLGSDRDVRQVYACAQRDTIASPELCWEQRERRRMAERVFVRWLEKGGLRFWVRQQLPKEMPAPFVLLLDVLRVNGGPIMWIELFDLYGVDGTQAADLIDRRVASLEDRWGHGLVLFLAGHSPGMGAPGRWRKSIAVDPRELNPQLRELISLTQTARLDQLREGLKYKMAQAFEGTSSESHYGPDGDSPLPSAPAPKARALKRGGATGTDEQPQKRTKGGRLATAGLNKGYRQVWDTSEREIERIRVATGLPAPPGLGRGGVSPTLAAENTPHTQPATSAPVGRGRGKPAGAAGQFTEFF